MPETIGFIGLGVMGAPMAKNVSAKYAIVAYDIDSSRVKLVPKAKAARSVAEVGEAARTVLLSLPTSEIVKDVVLGPGAGERTRRVKPGGRDCDRDRECGCDGE